MTEPLPYQSIDPELVNVACHLAHCNPEDLLAVAQHDDTLVVVVAPGPKYIFTAQQVADAVKELHYHPNSTEARLAHLRDKRPQPPTPAQVAALKAVAHAHPGELEAAEHNAPPEQPAPQRPPQVNPHQDIFSAPAHIEHDDPPKKRKAG